MRILIVDDEEIVHETIGEYLAECGHRVETAMDGQAALDILDLRSFDLAFVDLRMPGLDGEELLRKINGKSHDLPLVTISGHVDLASQGPPEDVLTVLVKPIRLLDLDQVLEAVELAPMSAI